MSLFGQCGLRCEDVRMHDRIKENHKRGVVMRRRWLQAVFAKAETEEAGGGEDLQGAAEGEEEEKEAAEAAVPLSLTCWSRWNAERHGTRVGRAGTQRGTADVARLGPPFFRC